MIDYKNASALLLTNPVGIDKEIQAIQIGLQTIPWLANKAFGRAFKQEGDKLMTGESNRKMIFYPEVYQKGGEPLIMMPNDMWQAYSFFYLKDPVKIAKGQEFMANQPTPFTGLVSLVLWANLSKVNPELQGRFTEVLKTQVLGVLSTNYSIAIVQMYDSYENVFSNYTITEEYRQYMKLPYTAFRIDFNLSYWSPLLNC